MGYIRLENFTRIGRVDSDGFIYSESMERLGRINKDGRIYGESFNYVGRIDGDGFIYLSNMKRIGRIHRDGYVYDESFNRVGKLDTDIVEYIFGKPSTSQSVTKSNRSNTYQSSSSSSSGIDGGYTVAAILSIIVGISVGNLASSFGVGFIAFIAVDVLVSCMMHGIKREIGNILIGIFIIAVVLFFMSR